MDFFWGCLILINEDFSEKRRNSCSILLYSRFIIVSLHSKSNCNRNDQVNDDKYRLSGQER